MKTFIISLLICLGLSLASYAKEAVAFVTHKIVINSEGKVERVEPMRSELVVPENSPTSLKDHYKNMESAETLFDFKAALNKAVDKTVSVVSGDTFKKVAGGVAGAVAAVGVGVGAYSALKGDEHPGKEWDRIDKKNWEKMNKDIDRYQKSRIDNIYKESQDKRDHRADKIDGHELWRRQQSYTAENKKNIDTLKHDYHIDVAPLKEGMAVNEFGDDF